jgi:hypothetical protein
MKSKNTPRSSEHGQALILIVLAMVVFLGITALAIDGGMIYSDRRHAQNASDASSLAGGGIAAMSLENSWVTYNNWNCGDQKINAAIQAAQQAAITRATKNEFTIDTNIDDKHGVSVTCNNVFNGTWRDKYLNVQTYITHDTKVSFAQFVFGGPLKTTVEAVTRIRPRMAMAFGNAIVGLRETCDSHGGNAGGVYFDGTANVSVTGGGIFSNACMVASGSVDVNVYGGYDITCVGSGCLSTNGSPTVVAHDGGQIIQGTQHLPENSYDIPAPDCNAAGMADHGQHKGGGTISPGRYSEIEINNSKDDLTMQPGLYCVGSFKATGGKLTGSGVTIYVTSGDFDTSGNAEIVLSSPPARNCSYCPPAIPGTLIYLAKGNTGNVTLLGNENSDYLGVVYAPNGQIDAGGTSALISAIHAQLVGDTVKVHGNTDIVINFDGDMNFQIPAMLELFK